MSLTQWIDPSRMGGLMLDVRGTIVDPVDDAPISQGIAESLFTFLTIGFPVALNTATSLQSLQQLVLGSLQRRTPTAMWRLPLHLYVDSGTLGYLFGSDGALIPIPDFDDITMTDIERTTVLSVVADTTAAMRNFSHKTKVKPGQVNFYCGGSWAERRGLADVLTIEFEKLGLSHFNVMVPTAKATIDIALCDKSRGTVDFERRQNINGSLVVIGDSLQERAPDRQMVESATHPLAIQVGPVAPASGTNHLHGSGPDRAEEILVELARVLSGEPMWSRNSPSPS